MDWTQELNKAFEEAKNALSQATLSHHPLPGAPIALTTDASDIAIGALLEQQVRGQWQPQAFYSRQLKKMEINYGTIELLGVHSAILHFWYFLEG